MKNVKQAAGFTIEEDEILKRIFIRMKETLVKCEASGKPSQLIVHLKEMERLSKVGSKLIEGLVKWEIQDDNRARLEWANSNNPDYYGGPPRVPDKDNAPFRRK